MRMWSAGEYICRCERRNAATRSPAHYDELVQVHTAISEWGRASLKFVYEMRSEDKTRVLATGMTQHALVNGEGRPVPVPDWFRALCGGGATGEDKK